MAGWTEAELWTAPDGARLALRHQDAQGPARAACIVVHGWGEHGGRYAHVAAWLAARGIASWGLDARGHGRTPGRRGHVDRFAQHLSDLVGLRKVVAAAADLPLVLLGHSHGGLQVLRYLESAPAGIAGAAVTSPFLAPSMRVPGWKVLLARLLADIRPSLPVATGIVLEHISTDPAVVAAAKADPLCHHVMSPRAWFEIVAAQEVLHAEAERIAVPLFVGIAGDDRIVSAPATRAFAASLRGDVTIREYPAFFHEILNERERDRVFADLAPWLDRVIAGAAA
jgi:lysophospholipase